MSFEISEGRVTVSQGGECPFECAYCYTYADGFVGYVNDSAEGVVSRLEGQVNQFDLVQLGCDTEVFLQQNKATNLIQRLTGLERDISFATKAALTDKSIDALVQAAEVISTTKHWFSPERKLVGFVSLTGLETAAVIEKKAPSPERRIETLRKLSEAGIPAFVYIRPLLPQIPESEINELIKRTEEYVTGYVVGKYYSDASMPLQVSGTPHMQMAWGPDKRDWNVYTDERIADLLSRPNFYSSSVDAVRSVTQNDWKEMLVSGYVIDETAGTISESVYATRAAIPPGTKRVTVYGEDLMTAPDLVYYGNILTGERAPLVTQDAYLQNGAFLVQPSNLKVESADLLLHEDGRIFVPMMYLLPEGMNLRDVLRARTADALLQAPFTQPEKVISIAEQLGNQFWTPNA